MARKRRYGLAASVAARRERNAVPAGDQGPDAEPAAVHRCCFADGQLWDRQGRPWRRVAEWLEPREDEVHKDVLTRDLLPVMLVRAKADRTRRKRTVPTVIVAERWRDDDGSDLVLFTETGPYPRAATWFD